MDENIKELVMNAIFCSQQVEWFPVCFFESSQEKLIWGNRVRRPDLPLKSQPPSLNPTQPHPASSPSFTLNNLTEPDLTPSNLAWPDPIFLNP